MNTEKFHNLFNATYFSLAALSFIALLGSLWWGGPSFAIATPLNSILIFLGVVYIIAALVSVRHACCGGLQWVGCSCGGKSKGSFLRSFALILPIPVFAYFLYGTMVKLSFDDSQRSFDNVKTQLELDRALFGNVRAEGITWSLAKRAFKNHYDEMGDRITLLLIQSMKDRHANNEQMVNFLLKHSSFHKADACAFHIETTSYPFLTDSQSSIIIDASY